jgi:hypothetical protein
MTSNPSKIVSDYTSLSTNTGAKDLLDGCVVQFRESLTAYIKYEQTGGKYGAGYLTTISNSNSVNTQFLLVASKSTAPGQNGYLLSPLGGQNTAIQLCYNPAAKDKGDTLVNGANPTQEPQNQYFNIITTGSDAKKNLTCQITTSAGNNFIGYTSGTSKLMTKIINTPTTWSMIFVTLGPNAWTKLFLDSSVSSYCCLGASGVNLNEYPNLPGACSNKGLASGTAGCTSALQQFCSKEGFYPKTPKGSICNNWCLANPADCYNTIKTWCNAGNLSNPTCACFDDDKFSKFKAQYTNDCKPPCAISNFTAGCFYPPCLFSGMSNVYNQNKPCPNNTTIFQQCANSLDNQGQVSGNVYQTCFQNAEPNPDNGLNINVSKPDPNLNPPKPDPNLNPPKPEDNINPNPDPNTRPYVPPPETTPAIQPYGSDLENFWAQYQWWIIGGAGILVILLVIGVVISMKSSSSSSA